MVGRGRGAVLPAWMDNKYSQPGASDCKAGENRGTWTEHTAPDGRKYYYNSELKKSSWSIPEGWNATGSGVGVWEEHRAPDGRTYYHNRNTKESKWSLPVGATVVSRKDVLESGTVPERNLPAFVPPPGALQPGPTPQFATAREAHQAFQRMLKDAQIPSWITWEHVTPIISVDRRFGSVVTAAEKKMLFDEYIRERILEEARSMEARQKEIENRFLDTLDFCTPLQESVVPNFEEARKCLSEDPVWNSISTDKERYDLFEKWLDRVAEKKEMEKEEVRKKERQALLEYLESCTWVSIETTWREAEGRLSDVEEFTRLSKYDRIQVFDEYMKKVEERESSSRSIQEEIRKRKESQSRIAMRRLLQEHFNAAFIHAKLCWKEYLGIIGENEVIKRVENNLTGSRPKDLFMDMIEEAEVKYEHDRPIIEDCFRGLSLDIKAIDFEQFKKLLMGCERYASITALSSIKLFLLEEQSKLATDNQRKRNTDDQPDTTQTKRMK